MVFLAIDVSVIMPVYNGEKYISKAIESVFAQTYKDFELIVVDDGSIDNTVKIVSEYKEISPVKFSFIRHQVNQGVSSARNSGIAVSTGEFLMLTDSDDIQKPERMKTCFNLIKSNPQIEMIFTDCEMIDAAGRLLNRRMGYPEDFSSHNAILYELKRNYLWTSLVMVRKTKDIWFDTNLPNAVDYDLFLRLLLSGSKLEIINEPLVYYRLHDSNISANLNISKKSVENILSKLEYEKVLNELKKRFPEIDVRISLSWAALGANMPQRALGFLDNISINFEVAFIQGVSYYKLGLLAKSLEAFRKANDLAPNDPATLNNFGVLLAKTTKGASNDEYFKRALNLRDGYLDATNNLKEFSNNNFSKLRITERPLRANFIHIDNYKLDK